MCWPSPFQSDTLPTSTSSTQIVASGTLHSTRKAIALASACARTRPPPARTTPRPQRETGRWAFSWVAPAGRSAPPVRRRARARMTSPEICTSLNVIIVPGGAREGGRQRGGRGARAHPDLGAPGRDPGQLGRGHGADAAQALDQLGDRRRFDHVGVDGDGPQIAGRAAPAPPTTAPRRAGPPGRRRAARGTAPPRRRPCRRRRRRARSPRARPRCCPPAPRPGATFARHETATRPVPRTSPFGHDLRVTSAACSSDARAAACAAAAALVSPGSPARARTLAADSAVTRLATNAALASPLSAAATSIPGAPALAGVTGGGAAATPRVRSGGAARSRRPRPPGGSV